MAEGKKGFFRRLVDGLTKTRNNIVAGIDSIFSGFSSIDDDFYEEIEEIHNRLDIVYAGPAADDEGINFRALRRVERDAREIEHVEHVRVDHLILQ